MLELLNEVYIQVPMVDRRVGMGATDDRFSVFSFCIALRWDVSEHYISSHCYNDSLL